MPTKTYYYAQEAPYDSYETYDSDIFYNDSNAEEDKIWVGGNDSGPMLNDSLYTDTEDHIRKAYSDIQIILSEADDKDEESTAAEIIDILRYYFENPFVPGSTLKNSELHKILKIILDLDTGSGKERLIKMKLGVARFDAVCQILEIFAGEPFAYKAINGATYNDWAYCIYPKSNEKMIPWIEAVLFNTGSLFYISREKIPYPDNGELDPYEVECDEAYTELSNKADILKLLAGAEEVSPSEIVILDRKS